jgi:hypothetical protein
MKPEIILQAVGLVVGAIFSLLQVRNAVHGSRSTLKTDLEILKLLDPTDPNHALVRAHVTESMRKIYPNQVAGATASGFKIYNWPQFFIGITFSLVFSAITLYLLRDGFSWWALMTGFFAVGGFGNLFMAFDPNLRQKKGADVPPPAA